MSKVFFFKSLVLFNIVFFLVVGGYYLKGSEIECKSADFVLDYKIDFADFAEFANNRLNDVNSINRNEKYDLDCSQAVDLNDLVIFCEHWLDVYPKPEDTYTAFKDALAEGNVQTALTYISEISQPRYFEIFQAIESNLPDYVAGMGNLTLQEQDEGTAVYEMTHQNGSVIYSFSIVFIKDDDGNWKIYKF